MKEILNKIVRPAIPLFPLLLITAIFILPLTKPGLIVGGDWTFPSSNQELRVFGDRAFSVWVNAEIPFGTQVSHNNLYLFQILAHLWASIGFNGISFQKITLFLTIFGIYVFSYRLLLKLTRSPFASVVGAMSYLFSPIVFNYLNMGWNYVLLFLALAPLFTQIALDFFKDGKKKHIIALGLISAISFFQSQSIVWLPLIFICIFISQVTRKNLLKNLLRFGTASIGIVIIVLIVHLPWLLPIILNPGNIINSTSAIDLKRFSEVLSISNQFRLWGSLYNQEFELAFPQVLVLFPFAPILICVLSPLLSSFEKKRLPAYLLVLLLISIAPTLYIFRGAIADLPFAAVVRDISRFLVITSLGFSLGIALTLSVNKGRLGRVIICIVLILSAIPYFLGRLYTLTGDPSPQSNEYKDFRARLLSLPEIENESTLPLSNQTNIFLPTGGFIFTKTDTRFNRDFWSIADIQGNFSPIASGMYFTDKSDFLISNLVQNYSLVSNNIDLLTAFFRVYGINNLVYRSGLESTYKSQLDRDGIQKKCQAVLPESDSDWSITSICTIKDTYPLIYASVLPRYSARPFSEILSEKNNQDRIVILGCPKMIKEKSIICNIGKVDNLASTAPSLKFNKISETKYRLEVEDIRGKFLLVFNQTYHPGWVIRSKFGEKLNLPHILVNQLVNGWVVDPAGDLDKEEYIIEFYPQMLYSGLLPISLISILIMLLYLVYQSKSKSQ